MGRGQETLDIETDFRQQLGTFTVLDEHVRNAEAFNVIGAETGIVGSFENRTSESAAERVFFDRDDEATLRDRFENRLCVERFREASVDNANIESLRPQILSGTDAIAELHQRQ